MLGWMCPLLVPLVGQSGLSGEWKTALSGLLLLGIPELFSLAAIAILGKSGYVYLKGVVFGLLRRLAPPDVVGPVRYRIGLVLFVLPLLFGWVSIYVANLIPGFIEHRIAFAVTGDLMLLTSLFVLGGDFWDKVRALFVHGARAQLPAPTG